MRCLWRGNRRGYYYGATGGAGRIGFGRAGWGKEDHGHHATHGEWNGAVILQQYEYVRPHVVALRHRNLSSNGALSKQFELGSAEHLEEVQLVQQQHSTRLMNVAKHSRGIFRTPIPSSNFGGGGHPARPAKRPRHHHVPVACCPPFLFAPRAFVGGPWSGHGGVDPLRS